MGLLHLPDSKTKPSPTRGSVFAPEIGRDAAPIVSATSGESLGQGWFHLQVTLRVLNAP